MQDQTKCTRVGIHFHQYQYHCKSWICCWFHQSHSLESGLPVAGKLTQADGNNEGLQCSQLSWQHSHDILKFRVTIIFPRLKLKSYLENQTEPIKLHLTPKRHQPDEDTFDVPMWPMLHHSRGQTKPLASSLIQDCRTWWNLSTRRYPLMLARWLKTEDWRLKCRCKIMKWI